MAPIFDANAGESGLRSLWSAGQDLVAAAAVRSELQDEIHEMENSLAELQNALEDAQYGYAEAHALAMAAGWTPHELTDLGLPRPTADHRDSSALHQPPKPRALRSETAAPGPARRRPARSHSAPDQASPPTEQDPERDDARRSSWEADQTSFLVASRSSDMPVWYESMRKSRITPSPKPFSAADLESSYWQGHPNPDDPQDQSAR
ncbi:hypothetical protein [Pengzhenrongella sp.]|jgi:hypothetical protein|uniref:hypothetical protein n=1 Tax=Pengzhenrongella sp. TaxID=2888820 RepID=UPI002F925AF4